MLALSPAVRNCETLPRPRLFSSPSSPPCPSALARWALMIGCTPPDPDKPHSFPRTSLPLSLSSRPRPRAGVSHQPVSWWCPFAAVGAPTGRPASSPELTDSWGQSVVGKTGSAGATSAPTHRQFPARRLHACSSPPARSHGSQPLQSMRSIGQGPRGHPQLVHRPQLIT